MLICGEFGEMVDVLGAGARIARMSEGLATRSQSIAQLTLLHIHVLPGFFLVNSEIFQSSPAS